MPAGGWSEVALPHHLSAIPFGWTADGANRNDSVLADRLSKALDAGPISYPLSH